MMLQHCAVAAEWKLAGGEAMTFSGYGAAFNNVDSYGDMIAPGAFADTLAEARKSGQYPAMLLQHGGFIGSAEDMTPIGVWTDFAENGKGLWVEGKLADTQRGKDAYTLLKMHPRPAITDLSIGYHPKEWTAGTKPKEPRRTLKKIDLVEVSLVTFPANTRARVQNVKSQLTKRELEARLRDAGLSHSEAKAVIAGGFDAYAALRDAGDDGARKDAALRRLIASLQGGSP